MILIKMSALELRPRDYSSVPSRECRASLCAESEVELYIRIWICFVCRLLTQHADIAKRFLFFQVGMPVNGLDVH